MNADRDALESSRQRSLEHVRTAMETVKRVIAMSESELEGAGDRRPQLEQRIVEGEQELATMQAELEQLESGTYPPPPPRLSEREAEEEG
jgi:septal ring factor EnvC (AmiA/AmiB activator)